MRDDLQKERNVRLRSRNDELLGEREGLYMQIAELRVSGCSTRQAAVRRNLQLCRLRSAHFRIFHEVLHGHAGQGIWAQITRRGEHGKGAVRGDAGSSRSRNCGGARRFNVQTQDAFDEATAVAPADMRWASGLMNN